MKTKLLLAVLSFVLFSKTYAQQNSSDYISGLIEPSAMVSQGTMLYVQGPKSLYQINTTSTTPSPTVIYSAPENFYMTNLTISGNIIYIAEENYVEVDDTSLGSRIISINLNNLSAPANVIYTTPRYVSSLAINGTSIYFSCETEPDNDDNFTVQVHRINIALPTPLVATVLVNNLSANKEANDMAFYNNNLLISVGGENKVFSIDVTNPSITVTEYLNNLGFNKGMFISGNSFFIADAHYIKTKQLNVLSSLTNIAQNTTYQDNINGSPFYANFRDVVLIGDRLYMTLQNQGRVVSIQDATLSNSEISPALKAISIFNSKTKLTIIGLENNQTATVYNLSGQQIIRKKLTDNENTIDISTFSDGVYLLKLDDEKTFKFIK